VAQDSARPDFWDARYRGNVTPWDAHGVPAALAEWLGRRESGARVLIPGCGTGYEARHFARSGYQVLAIDFSEAAVEAAQAELGELALLVRRADFFTVEGGPFDIVYERAFLCALPRRMWEDWARRVAELVALGGLVAGFFYFNDNAKGPPFGISPEALDGLLAGAFERVEDVAVPPAQSLSVFEGWERWQVWRRRDSRPVHSA
jgi:SAM-dependent methyltransferase